MITVQKAQQLVLKNIPILKQEKIDLQKALGNVLAENITAALPLPLFDNSAMDGFAVWSEDVKHACLSQPVVLRVKGAIRAGDCKKYILKSGETYRIMTGSRLPECADTVLPKEQVHSVNGTLQVIKPLQKGQHIRYEGEEIRKGNIVLKKKSVIHPATLGILASLGRKTVTVYKKPTVSVLAIGSELVKPGRSLKPGQIYDSNSPMVCAALKSMGIHSVMNQSISDERSGLKAAVNEALQKSDVVLLMGGVSEGDYDFVKSTLKQIKVKTLFWKVSQKPGKPLYFGRKGKKLIFGLPGNPAAVFTCFYEYVYPALRAMSGFKSARLPRRSLLLESSVKSDPNKTLFLKAKINEKSRVKPLTHQASHMISSLHEANALIVVSPSGKGCQKGRKVAVDCLPCVEGAAS
jgi:molybdopterin molybdotransferase